MELSLISAKQIATMFLITLCGVLCYKIKIIDKKTNSALSAMVLNIVNPAVIFLSYQKEFDVMLLKGLGAALALSALSFFVSIVLCSVLIRRGKKGWDIERIAIVYSNCGFIGIPLIKALIGDLGVFYLAAYLTCFNLLLWTHGVMLMKKVSGIKEILSNAVSPCIVAIFAGIIFFILQIRLPEFVYNAVESVASMNTPLAMIVAGATIAQTDILSVIRKTRTYLISAYKLILIPVAACLIAFFAFRLGAEREAVMTVVIASACPTAASGTLFAIRFGKDALYASEIFALTTLLCSLSIPGIMLLAGVLFG